MLDTKKILAANLETLLSKRPDISRLNLSRQIHVADGTLGRIKYGTGNPTIDVLEQLASFFKIEVWQLFYPDLGKTVTLGPGENGDKTVFGFGRETIDRLPPEQRGEIRGYINRMLEELDRGGGAEGNRKAG